MLKLGIRFKKFGVPPATILLSSLGSPPLFQLRLGCKYVDNDPSAGSPTETLLRLILPLSDKVYETSRIRTIAGQTQSESFTGSLNR